MPSVGAWKNYHFFALRMSEVTKGGTRKKRQRVSGSRKRQRDSGESEE